MNPSILHRDLHRDDLPALGGILDRTGLFPSNMLGAMAEPYLNGTAPHHWRVAVAGEQPVGFAYAEPERMTEGTHNLLAIAVEPDVQQQGIGKAIVTDLIDQLRDGGGRVLIVETSSLDDYAATRAFYDRQAFTNEARIRDFYTDGEDKLVYWKRL